MGRFKISQKFVVKPKPCGESSNEEDEEQPTP